MFTNTTGKPIYVNADKSAVVDGDSAEAAFLLVGPDGQIPREEADKYGLTAEPKKTRDAEAGKPDKSDKAK